VTGGLVADAAAGRAKIAAAIESGRAAEIFGRMVAALGGPADFMERPENYLAAAPIVRPVMADRGGVVSAVDTRALGLAVVALGGGRTRAADAIDHAVGLTDLAELGQRIAPGVPLAMVHARTEAGFEAATKAVQAAYARGDVAPAQPPLIVERITEGA
jgi:thymidine phosphorylase